MLFSGFSVFLFSGGMVDIMGLFDVLLFMMILLGFGVVFGMGGGMNDLMSGFVGMDFSGNSVLLLFGQQLGYKLVEQKVMSGSDDLLGLF